MPFLTAPVKQLRRLPACLVASILSLCLTGNLAGQVKMNVSTQPSTGVAGTTVVNAIGSGFPTANGTTNPSDITVFLSSSCGGGPLATAQASSIKTVMGTQSRVGFLIPATLSNGTYSVTLTGKTADGTVFQSSDGSCSEVAVTHVNSAVAACSPSTSLAVYAPPSGGPVTVYSPNGCWNCTTKGIQAVVIEGNKSVTKIDTPGVVNSCAANPANGATVCVDNNTGVYVLQGNTLTNTLKSSGEGSAPVSGGECTTCGVAINPLTNQAVVSIALPFTSQIPFHSGYQVLDLNSNTMGAIVPAYQGISEEINLDPTRGFLLSANELSNYDIFTVAKDGSLTEFTHPVLPGDALDASAEDCSTGIAVASTEGSNNLYIADLTQIKFTPGKPGSWSAPEQVFRATDLGGSGIAIAQGSSHLGIMTPEFVNNGPFTVIQLPSASGNGVPQLVDYAVAGVPGFVGTADPHGVTAYTSPNDGKAYGILESGVPAVALAKIDLACVLALPRVLDSHRVSGSVDACVQIIPTGNQQLSPLTITSTPVITAAAGDIYSYDVNASDAYLFQLQYSLTTAPAGMVINPQTGLISWVPDPKQAGTQNVSIRVENVFGTFTSQQYQISVNAPIYQRPAITSTPVTQVIAGQAYAYQINATDPGGRGLGFFLAVAPSDMTIDPRTGLISWLPSKGLVGQVADVTVIATGAFTRQSAAQTFKINIVPGVNHPPLITSAPSTNAIVGQAYTYTITAKDPDNDPLAYSFVSAPVGMNVDFQTGVITWTPSNDYVGEVNVTVRAQDPGRLVATQSFTLHVQRAYPVPVIEITGPVRGTVIKSPIDITANISDPSGSQPPVNWTVDLIRADNKDTRRIGSGSGAVNGGVIAHLDPTSIRDDSYLISITVSKAGEVDSQLFDYSVATQNLKLGNFRTSFTDISIPVAGIPLTISRNYDSLDTSIGDFSNGWRLGLPGSVVDTVQSLPQQGFTPTTRVYVTTPDGRREGFTFTPIPPGFFQVTWTPAFTPDPGVYDTLSVGTAALVDTSDGFVNFFGGAYKPTNYLLTTKSRVQYLIDEVAGLQQIIDPNGNTVTVTPSGLQSSFGPSLGFERDTNGRITKITEPGGNSVRYQYDDLGNLVSSFDQLGNETKYLYELSAFPHYLTKVQDPLGRPVTRNVYNGDGKLVAQCDANGDVISLARCVTFSADSNLRLQTIVNARGLKTDFLMDERGNILTEKRYTDNFTHLDTMRTFDANNNVLTKKDPAGNVTSQTWDGQGNLLTQTDSGGHKQSHTYLASCSLPLSDTDAGGNTTTYKYDDDNHCNLRFVTTPIGAVTEYQYNAAGQRSEFIDPVGNTWSLHFDANGFPNRRTDPFDKTTKYQFSPTGDLQSRVDRLGRRVDFTYDNTHNLLKESWADGHVFTFTYDASGELKSAIDINSQLTFSYDNTGHVLTAGSAATGGTGNITLTYGYDVDGNIVTTQDSLGGTTAYSYDALDRLASIQQSGTNVQPKRVDMAYDYSGLLQSISRFSDLGGTNAVVNTTFGYDCGGCGSRMTSIVHQNAKDHSAIDARTWTLDDTGNIQHLTDADGSHAYTYDAAQRLLSANHTSSTSIPNEFYVYDLAGNRLSSHLSSQYNYSYKGSGAGNRLVSNDQFTFQYDDEGNLVSQQSKADGSTTTYSYDYRNRLTAVSVMNSQGAVTGGEQFTYDSINRRSQSLRGGQLSSYVYDNSNPILKLSGNSGVTSRRLYAPFLDGVLADEASSQTRWFVADQIGSVHSLILNSGQTTEHYVYDSFGQVVRTWNQAPDNDLQFAGREFDPMGLGYLRARYLRPDLGRFLNEDRLEPLGYSYASGNPLTFTDPLGLSDTVDYAIEQHHLVPQGTKALTQVAKGKVIELLGSIHNGKNILAVAYSVHKVLHSGFYYALVDAYVTNDLATAEELQQVLDMLIEYVKWVSQ